MNVSVLLRDVAAAAGVSVATASRALRGLGAAATRARVTVAAQRLGYRPDPLLGALARYRAAGRAGRRLEPLAFLSTWPVRGAGPVVPPELAAHAAALGYRLEAIAVGADPAAQRALGARLAARGVRGLLLGTGPVQQDELDLPWDAFAACVSVSGAPAMARFPSVTFDYAGGLRLALAELAARGYRRPGLAIDRGTLAATRAAALTGWGHAFACSRGRPATPLVLEGTGDAAALAAWVRAERLDAVLAFAPQVRHALRRAGLGAPEALGFAALDLLDERAVAGVQQPRAACARIALDLLAARLQRHGHGLVDQPFAVQVPGVWRDGATVRGR